MNVNSIKLVAGKATILAKKHAPEILIGTGIASTIGSTVLACRATLKIDDILDESRDKQSKIQAVCDGEIEVEEGAYSEEDAKKDLFIVKVQTVANIGKAYLPAATLGAFGIGCILGAHGIMRKRNVALLGLYKAAESGFAKYRERVVEELGEQKDHDFFYGVRDEVVKEKVKDEKTGKSKTVKKVEKKADGPVGSQYAVFFDESNPNWSKDPEQNKYFLTTVQNYMNDKLRARGHVFLNEVYDELGFPHTQAGQLVGWIHDGSNGGDSYIDFHIFDGMSLQKREFVNGYERSILLDFNVDGVVYDLI